MNTSSFARSTSDWLKIAGCLLAVFYGFFLGIFALDARSAGEFVIHLLPSLIVFVVVLFAWKTPAFGGPLLLFLGILATFHYHTYASGALFLMISTPLFAAGALLIGSAATEKTNP